jgi:hypothetical protein
MYRTKIPTDPAAGPRAVSDRWYVTDGSISVGPVHLDLIARGVDAGKVPLESFVRNEAWTVWRPVGDVVEPMGSEDDEPSPGRLRAKEADPFRDAYFDAARTHRNAPRVRVPPPRPSDSEPATDDIASPGRPALPEEFIPADAFAGTAGVEDALLLLLSSAVQSTGADAAIVHQVDDEGASVVCAHGPEMFTVLGERVGLLDPAVVAAAAGAMVLAEPEPGPAGAAVRDRLMRLGEDATGALMIPIRPRGHLFGMLEVGRGSPFRATEVAALEGLVAALVAKLERCGWA